MKKYLLLLLIPILFVLSPVKAETNLSESSTNSVTVSNIDKAENSDKADQSAYTRYAADETSESGNRFFLDPERDKDFELMMIAVTIIVVLLHIASFVASIIFVIVLIKRIRKISKDGAVAQPTDASAKIKEALDQSSHRKDDSAVSTEETSHFDSPFE